MAAGLEGRLAPHHLEVLGGFHAEDDPALPKGTKTLLLLGPAVSAFGHMGLTYGTLSGVMLALLFFYGVGFALVFGTELNAALAQPPEAPLKIPSIQASTD